MLSAFSHPWLLLCLASLPALAVLGAMARHRRLRDALRMAGPALGARLLRRGPGWLRLLCVSVGLSLLGMGTAGPRWGRDWSQSAAPGRDLMVVLDCSRSMHAEAPSRLARARETLLGLADGLRRQGGHRVGLVVFAGSARLACPLTHDLDHFAEAVQDVEPDAVPPGLSGGTRIGAAVSLALESFGGRAARDILLVSDGDDPARDGEFRVGRERARAEGVPVHCLAVGDIEPRKIPQGKAWLMDGKEPALTRLELAPLEEIARRTGGKLLRLGFRPIDLASYYREWVADATGDDSPDALPAYRSRHGWFLFPAFVLLLLAACLPETKP